MWIDGAKRRAARALHVLSVTCLVASPAAEAEQGQYRSRVQITPPGEVNQGRVLSVEELEQQINALDDPYAKSSAGRHLARHYVEQKEYDKAIEYYRTALAAKGLSDIANREMLRELAQVYLLSENYAAAAATLERALRIDLVPVPGDYLLLATAQYRLGNYVAVVAALDAMQGKRLALDIPQMRQTLALYYRAGAWSQCETLLQRLLELEPNNPDNWHQLAAVYLQQNKRRQALDQLALAREKSVPFQASDLNLLVDLMAVNGNPYGAADTLRQALQAGEIPATAANYRKLFELWFQARESRQASAALVQAARLSGDTELYLYLAQLQMEEEDWQGMQQTMLAACAKQLEDRYVSRANLFLGVSQLKLGDREGARRSLINATLVGGAGTQAGQWLDYMGAEPATEDEARRVVGPCYGSEGKQRQVASLSSPVGAGQDATVAEAGAEGEEFQFKTLPAQRLFYSEYDMPLAELAAQLKPLSVKLGVTLVKSGGTADGPLQIIAPAGAEEGALQLAMPSRGSPRAGGQYKTRRTTPARAAYRVRRGSAEELAGAWLEFSGSLREAGYELSGEQRLVFLPSGGGDSDSVGVEIQIGIVE